MANLSSTESAIVADNLGLTETMLDAFRTIYFEPKFGKCSSTDDFFEEVVRSAATDEGAQCVLDNLFSILYHFPACLDLPSRVARYQSLGHGLRRPDGFSIKDVSATAKLLQRVIQSDNIFEIYEATYELVSVEAALDEPRTVRKLPDEVLTAVSKDWTRKYFPDSLNALREHIRFCLRDERPFYSKSLVFVQSSGMGKSRLASKFGETCPMIDFVLRDHYDGYPPGDPEILSLLRHGLLPEDEAIIHQSLSKDGNPLQFSSRRATVIWNHSLSVGLLQASFTLFSEWLSENNHADAPLKDIAKLRHKEMQASASNLLKKDYRSEKRKSFCTAVREQGLQIARHLVQDRGWRGLFNDEADSQIRDALANSPHLDKLHHVSRLLMANFGDCKGAEPVLVVVLDEAASLLREPRSSVSSPGIYVALNRVFSCLKEFPVWLFNLSTESEIEKLLPPEMSMVVEAHEPDDYSTRSSARLLSPRGRGPKQSLRLLPAFVSFPLDVLDRSKMRHPENKTRELAKPMSDFVKPEHMMMFGRPLWQAYTNNVEAMYALAKLKLRGGSSEHFDPKNVHHVFAALSFRLSLDACVENSACLPLLRTAVGAYMRVVIAVNQQTGFLDTVTPSEPILARAAMEHLCEGRNWYNSVLTLTNQLFRQGLIEKGLKGELFSRLVIILAQDWIREKNAPSRPLKIELMPSFSVKEFLQALYAEGHHQAIQDIPVSILDGRLNFTHFTPAHENLTPNIIPSLCHDLLRRCAALQLAPGQPTYDKLIPFYCGDEKKNFQDSKYGVIMVQDKNRAVATTPDHIFQENFDKVTPLHGSSNDFHWQQSIREEHPTKFGLGKKDMPFLFLLLDMGVSKGSSPAVQISSSKGKRKPRIWAIHSRGRSTDIFRSLELLQVEDAAEEFFAQSTHTPGLATDLAQQNVTFGRLSREFRYAEHGSGGSSDEEGEESSDADTAMTGA